MSKFENMNGNDILAQWLWNNKFVKVKSKSLYTLSLVSWKKNNVSAHRLNGRGPIVREMELGWERVQGRVEVGLSLPRVGDGWVGQEQLGDFGGLVVPCSPFPRRH